MVLFRLPPIYEEFYHTINNADHEKDLRLWSNTHGVNMAMNWPQFEVSRPFNAHSPLPLWSADSAVDCVNIEIDNFLYLCRNATVHCGIRTRVNKPLVVASDYYRVFEPKLYFCYAANASFLQPKWQKVVSEPPYSHPHPRFKTFIFKSVENSHPQLVR